MLLEKRFQPIALLSEFVSLAKSRWALISVGGCHKSEHVPDTLLSRTFQCWFWDFHINLTEKNCELSTRVIFSKIQNPGEITCLSIDMTAVLKRKSEKDFKKLVPICGNLSYNLEFEQFLAQSNINKVYKAVWECAAISY